MAVQGSAWRRPTPFIIGVGRLEAAEKLAGPQEKEELVGGAATRASGGVAQIWD
jgi:hypothetical protein